MIHRGGSSIKTAPGCFDQTDPLSAQITLYGKLMSQLIYVTRLLRLPTSLILTSSIGAYIGVADGCHTPFKGYLDSHLVLPIRVAAIFSI